MLNCNIDHREQAAATSHGAFHLQSLAQLEGLEFCQSDCPTPLKTISILMTNSTLALVNVNN